MSTNSIKLGQINAFILFAKHRLVEFMKELIY